jgi:IS1 family transposase
MKRLSRAQRVAVAAMLVEGNSIRSTVRLTGVSLPTVLKLLVDLGEVCSKYQDLTLRNLPCRKVQADECWSYCYAKAANVPEGKRGQFGFGDVWTWVGLCADTKLVPSWRVGPRDAATAHEFMQDLASRLRHRVQLTTDSLRVYLEAVEDAFGIDVDYATLQKVYRSEPTGERRYSPPKIQSSHTEVIIGQPNPKHIATSYIERQNLTMRMSMRRFTRLTNAFSKKIENHTAAIALYYMYYNFCRVHQTLRVTPAMQAGVSDHVWSLDEVVMLLEAAELRKRKSDDRTP